jgi:hypothetical protein
MLHHPSYCPQLRRREATVKATSVPPDVDCASILPGFDFADAYAVDAPVGVNAIEAKQRAFARNAGWIRALVHLRNRLGALVGLKPAPSLGFPIIRQSPQEVLMGFDDRHLDFRVAVTVVSGRATLTTVVRCHNFWGRCYLAAIMPFHRVIARRMTEKI